MSFRTCSAGALSGRISVSSSLLAATMNQKSSLREVPQFVSGVLTANTLCPVRDRILPRSGMSRRAIKRHDKAWSKGERPRKIENERNRRLRLRFDLNSTRIAGGSRREALKAARSEVLFSDARRTLVALLVLHLSFRVTTAQRSSQRPHSAISIYGLLINC